MGKESMLRRKELKEQYKTMKKPMGIFSICSNVNNKCYLKSTNDIKGTINGAKARLWGGTHPCRSLQKEWNELGEENFIFAILENLEYDKDESKTDYSEDLALLQMIWEEKFEKEGRDIFKK